jgi:RNA 2',3'-cyclic 3'-phosphodiesterase
MPAALRLFLALWPDADVRADLAAHQAQWQWPAGARLSRIDGLHLTLHFIGAVDAERVPALRAACRLPMAPCTLTLDRPELWPNHCAVLCARDVPPALAALHAALAQALRTLELPVERRGFRPHVTLARHAAGASPPPDALPVQWTLRDPVLVQSAGGRYTPLTHDD